jgi:hypothetical protein
VLLSGLVLPGLGQLANGALLKGLAFAGATVAALAVFVHRVARETLKRLPTDPFDIDLGLPLRLAREIQRDNASFFFWVTVAVVALWVGSILDAWRDAQRS